MWWGKIFVVPATGELHCFKPTYKSCQLISLRCSSFKMKCFDNKVHWAKWKNKMQSHTKPLISLLQTWTCTAVATLTLFCHWATCRSFSQWPAQQLHGSQSAQSRNPLSHFHHKPPWKREILGGQNHSQTTCVPNTWNSPSFNWDNY